MIAVGLAWAAVAVVDGSGCVETERLELELAAELGDEVLRRLDVRVSRETDALSLQVSEGGRSLWARRLRVDEADCPVVADLVARSVAQGLAALPDWQFDGPHRAPELFGGVGGGWGPDAPLRWGLLGGVTAPLGARVGWGVGAELSVSPLRLDDGVGGDVWQGAFDTGPQVDIGRSQRLRVGAAMQLGGGRVVPRPGDLAVDMGWVPAAAVTLGVTWVQPSPLRVGLGARAPLNRIALGWQGQEALEPALRAILWVGIGGGVTR